MKKIFRLQAFLAALALSQFTHAQNVGIGTTNPTFPLTLQTSGSTSNWGFMHTNGTTYLGSFIYSTGAAAFGTRSNHPLYFFTNNSDAPPAMSIDAAGVNVGLGTRTPLTNLDIYGSNTRIQLTDNGSGYASTFSRYANRLEIQSPDIFQVAMGTVANPSFLINSSGNIGMGNNSPNNKLEIGTATGFSGNDFAIGNNGKGMSFYQSGAASFWYSNTNFALMPNTGNGFVGIGTTTPSQKLEVNGNLKLSGNIIVDNVQAMALSSGFQNYGNGYQVASYYIDKENQVHLRGSVLTSASNGSIFLLPPGYRPLMSEIFVVNNISNSTAEIRVDNGGSIFFYSGVTGVQVFNLSGITFRVDQ
ncbi:MAG: hypothetical protein JSS98_02695 [Bacteroidetes bacterium]|nr:hypothetical protein [Bacteroidota bacterium]